MKISGEYETGRQMSFYFLTIYLHTEMVLIYGKLLKS